MLENTLLFYKYLFRERRWHELSRRRVLVAMQQSPCFDASMAAQMGANITPKEVEHALTLLQRGKAPEPNGIPSEFCINRCEFTSLYGVNMLYETGAARAGGAVPRYSEA